MAGSAPPIYQSRWEKFKLGLLNIAAGLFIWTVSAPLGQFLVAVGLLMLGSGILRGGSRIA